jgi:hypothetical protein
MKRPQNPAVPQLNLPLLTQSPAQLPSHPSQELEMALAELLLNVARACMDTQSGEHHASQIK